MIFFINNDGTISKNIPESVYQGSSNANNIYVVAPFASNLSATVSFRLPNGVITVPYALSYTGEVSSFTDHAGNTYRGWSFALPNDITQHFGTVIAQFAFRGVGNKLLATSATSFTVNRGVPSALPEAPSETVYDQILENLSAIQSDLGNGYYTARAVYPFNSSYTYQANELVYYPEGEYGIYLQSLRANNTQAPYTNGILGSRWKVVLDFNAISVRFSEMESKFDDMQNSFDGVVDNAKSEADRAKKSADEANIAQGAAQKSADSASASASDALQAKNTTEAVKSDTETIKKVAENARDVAQKFAESVPAFEYNGLTYYSARYYAELSRGYFENRNKAFAFDTTEQALSWYNGEYARADGLTKDDLVVGDLIFVKTVDVPDAWYSGTPETNSDMWWVGYPFSQWEGDKVALLEYTERAESAAEKAEEAKIVSIEVRDEVRAAKETATQARDEAVDAASTAKEAERIATAQADRAVELLNGVDLDINEHLGDFIGLPVKSSYEDNTTSIVRTSIITGETGVNSSAQRQLAKAHGIELGQNSRDYLNLNEVGGVFNFYKTDEVFEDEDAGDGELVAQITPNGIYERGTRVYSPNNKPAPADIGASAVYTGTSSTKSSNATLSTLRVGYSGGNLYIWNS